MTANKADAGLLAEVLWGIAYMTPSANGRKSCLTRALELEGSLKLDRYRHHRLRVSTSGPATSIEVLRVLVDPIRADGMDQSVAWVFHDGTRVGLTLRGGGAVPDDGAGAAHALCLSTASWAELVVGKVDFEEPASKATTRN